ncbi:glycosyltransferase family 39 protein [Patescibacteria group bacterium]|nr:glycosyltransferase family 39 protein [Patescibacteria group bacterium]
MKKPKKIRKKRSKSWASKPIFWILLLAIFLRFYKLGELFHWTLDEEFWSYIPFNIATGYHIPLIGGPISGTGLYLGPLFVWLMAIPFFLTQGNPIGIAAFVSSLGVLTVAVMFWVGKTLFDRTTGLVAALLSASSFLWVIYDRKYWNASPIPLLSLITIFCMYRIAKGKMKWSYVLAFVLALAFHAHMSSGALLLFVFLGWIVLKLPVRKKEVLSAIALFLALQLPLVLFEFRHQFINTKALMGLFAQKGESTPIGTALGDIARLAVNTAGRLFYAPVNLDIANELTLCTQYAEARFQPPFWTAVLAIAVLVFMMRRRSKLGHKLILLLMGVNFLGLVWHRMRAGVGNWYPGQLSEYFFFPSFPAVFLGLASFTTLLMRRIKRQAWLVKLGLALLIGLNVAAIITAKHSDGFAKKREIVRQVVQKVGNEPFLLTVENDDPCRLYGFRYLFSVYSKEPSQSYLDPQFGWLYERRLPKRQPTKAVVISSQSGIVGFRIEEIR